MSNLCKIGKVFCMKAQTCLSEASFCDLGKREQFLMEEILPALAISIPKSGVRSACRLRRHRRGGWLPALFLNHTAKIINIFYTTK